MSELPDRYTEGVWYDSYNGDYLQFENWGDGVALLTPDGDHFHTLTYVEFEAEQSNFRQVSEDAVEDPVAIVQRALRMMERNNIEELAGVPFEFEIDLRYAKEQVEISEK